MSYLRCIFSEVIEQKRIPPGTNVGDSPRKGPDPLLNDRGNKKPAGVAEY